MSVSKLPSGRWRAQIHDASVGKNVSVANIIGGPRSYKTQREAKAARAEARKKLAKRNRNGITVNVFRDRWLTDPLFAPDKESTRLHYTERTSRFAREYGHLPIDQVDDDLVSIWLAGGNASTVPALRAMFNAASSVKGGRSVQHNPFNKLGLARGKGNAEKDPPSESVVWELIAAARRKSGPYFAAWLQVAAFTGMRPGELDALRWENVDFDTGRIRVVEQFSAKSRTFTLPKNGLKRDALLTPPAREALVSVHRDSRFCFENSRGGHFTYHARVFHWDRVREATGFADKLYLATRHFFGSYAVNELGLESEVVAFAMGHEDGGELVRAVYGHRNRERALGQAMAAFEGRSNVTQIHAVREAG
jgi:integrase